MPELYKTLYTSTDLVSPKNSSPMTPSILDDLAVFRLSRDPHFPPYNPPHIYKTNSSLSEFTDFASLPEPPENWEEWGDARLFKHGGKYYINANKINWNRENSPLIKQRTEQDTYTSLVSVLDIENNFKETEICPLQWSKNESYATLFQEKNYAFFEYDDELYFMRGISGGKQHLYKLNLESGQADFINATKYETKYPESKYGWLKICSTPFYYDNFFWATCHSHTDPFGPYNPKTHPRTLYSNYYVGICCFEAKPPFKIIKMSQNPIFDYSIYYKNVSEHNFFKAKKGIMVWPSSLVIKDDIFQIGCTTLSMDHQDFINFSYEEILKHLDDGVSYNYPTHMFKGTSIYDVLLKRGGVKFGFNKGYDWLDDMSLPVELS